MAESSQRILKHSGIYLLGTLLGRGVGFIMLPIYTQNLTPADYGVIELLYMIIDLVAIAVSMRIGQSIYRYYHNYDNELDRKQVAFSAYLLTIATSLAGMLLLLCLSPMLTEAVFGNQSLSWLLSLFSISLVLQGMVETPMVVLRAQQKPCAYLAASISKLAMQLSLNIYFIVYRQMHVEGVIYSGLISGAVMSLVLGVYLVSYTGLSFSMSKVKEMVTFSLPFTAMGILGFYINFGDRYFIRMFGGGIDAVGIYSLAYKFGFLLIVIAGEPFFNIWDSEKYKIYKNNPSTTAFEQIFIAYVSVVAFAFLGISLFGRTIIKAMANREYWGAVDLIPVICIAFACNCMEGFANLGFLVSKQTKPLSYGTILAGVVVTLGYLTLIPRFGSSGAAWATFFAFSSRLLCNGIGSKRYADINLGWFRVALVWVLAGFVWKGAVTFSPQSEAAAVFVSTVAIALYISGLLYLPILPHDIRIRARKWLSNPRSSLRLLRGGLPGR